MNTNDLKRLRTKIEAQLCGLEASTITVKSEIRESAGVNANVFQDQLDCAKAQVDLKTASQIYNKSVAQQTVLQKALMRMDNGTFGLCQSCGNEIVLRRLEAMPGATLCLDCQERREFRPLRPKGILASNHIQIRWSA
jgi:DnaK suppressor protein